MVMVMAAAAAATIVVAVAAVVVVAASALPSPAPSSPESAGALSASPFASPPAPARRCPAAEARASPATAPPELTRKPAGREAPPPCDGASAAHRWQPWVPAWSSQQNVRTRYSRRAQHIHDSTLIMLDEIDIVWKPGRQRCGKTPNRTSQDAAPVPRGPRPRQPHTQRMLG